MKYVINLRTQSGHNGADCVAYASHFQCSVVSVSYRKSPVQMPDSYRKLSFVSASKCPSQGEDHRFESGTGYQHFRRLLLAACFRFRSCFAFGRPKVSLCRNEQYLPECAEMTNTQGLLRLQWSFRHSIKQNWSFRHSKNMECERGNQLRFQMN